MFVPFFVIYNINIKEYRKCDFMTKIYVNRELSWLKFNERVLEEAESERVPLCERLNFISIYQSNLDEFFMVRIGSLTDQMLVRSEEHTSELQSRQYLVCRLLLEKK